MIGEDVRELERETAGVDFMGNDREEISSGTLTLMISGCQQGASSRPCSSAGPLMMEMKESTAGVQIFCCLYREQLHIQMPVLRKMINPQLYEEIFHRCHVPDPGEAPTFCFV